MGRIYRIYKMLLALRAVTMTARLKKGSPGYGTDRDRPTLVSFANHYARITNQHIDEIDDLLEDAHTDGYIKTAQSGGGRSEQLLKVGPGPGQRLIAHDWIIPMGLLVAWFKEIGPILTFFIGLITSTLIASILSGLGWLIVHIGQIL